MDAPPDRPLQNGTERAGTRREVVPQPARARAPAWIAVAGALVAAALGGNGPRNGDAAAYALQVLHGPVDARPAHLGYLVLADALAALLPVDASRVLDLLSALALGVVVWVAGRLARDGPVVGALVALGLALPAGPFGEVDLVLAAAVGLSAVAAPVPATVAFAFAAAVSPAALVWAPAVGWTRWVRGGGAAPVAAGVALWLLACAPWLPEILLGPRGVLAATADPLPVGRALRESLLGIAPAWSAPLLFLGVLAAPTRAVAGGAALFAAALTLERVGGVEAQLPTIPFAAAVAATGAAAARRAWPRAAGTGVPLLLGLGLAGGFRAADVARWQVRRETAALLALVDRVGPEERVVGPWGWGRRWVLLGGDEARWQEAAEVSAGGTWVLPPGDTRPGPGRWEPVPLAGLVVWHTPGEVAP